MAKIDDFLKATLAKSGDELVLASGKPPAARAKGQSAAVAGAAMTTAEIDTLLGDVVPIKRLQEASFKFRYSSTAGSWSGIGGRNDGTIMVIIRKAALGDPTLDGEFAPAAPAAAAPASSPAMAAAAAGVDPADVEISAVDDIAAAPAAPPPPPPPPPAAPRPAAAPAAPTAPAAPRPAAPAAAAPQPTAPVMPYAPPPPPPAPRPAAYGIPNEVAGAEPLQYPILGYLTGGVPAINRLFEKMMKNKASDLHLSSTVKPMIRHDGSMKQLTDENAIDPAAMWKILAPITPDRNVIEFNEKHDTDFAYEIAALGRFRCNIFMDRKGPGAVFRTIPTKVLSCDDLNIPQSVRKFCGLSKGLVLVTGPTGSGKSTTLAALIDQINATRDDHIITVEDPVEFVHQNKKCLINQREIHVHTDSFKNALRAALREDPDIVLVGEMRDLETIEIAIETAETGHLVFGTLHTTTAPSTVGRIIEQFPADKQEQIRVMLSESLKGVVSQTLCKKIGGGRIAALEILVINTGISNLIRENKVFQIASVMQTQAREGMQVLSDVLANYVKAGTIEPLEGYIKAVDKKGFITSLENMKWAGLPKLLDGINNLGAD